MALGKHFTKRCNCHKLNKSESQRSRKKISEIFKIQSGKCERWKPFRYSSNNFDFLVFYPDKPRKCSAQTQYSHGCGNFWRIMFDQNQEQNSRQSPVKGRQMDSIYISEKFYQK